MATKILTKTEVREIAREEATKVNKNICRDINDLKRITNENRDILDRLERLLLGEVGVDEEDTLKARANFAYIYAKRNSEAKIVERAIPAIEWFEDMSTKDPGEKESNLESLGRLIGLFGKIEWLLAVLGITTILNALPVIKTVLQWVGGLIN